MMNKKIIYLIEYLAFYSLVIFEIFMPHTLLSRIALVIFVLFSFVLFIVRGKIFWDSYFLTYIVFLIVSLFINFFDYSIDINTSNAMLGTITLNFFFCLSVFNYLMSKKNIYNIIYNLGFVSLIFSFYVLILSFSTGLSTRLGTGISLNVLGSIVEYNANHISIISGFAIIIYYLKYINYRKLRYLIIELWFVFIILLTGSRKGFILILLAILFMIFRSKKNFTIKLFIGVFLVVFLSFIIFDIPFLYDLIGFRIEAMFNYFLGSETTESSIATRNDYILLGWQYFLQKPWFGYGLDTFRVLNYTGTYSHNNYIELLVSGGLISLLLFYWRRIQITLSLFTRKCNDLMYFALMILVSLLLLEVALVTYYERYYLLLTILTLVIYRKSKISKSNY